MKYLIDNMIYYFASFLQWNCLVFMGEITPKWWQAPAVMIFGLPSVMTILAMIAFWGNKKEHK